MGQLVLKEVILNAGQESTNTVCPYTSWLDPREKLLGISMICMSEWIVKLVARLDNTCSSVDCTEYSI